MRRVDMLPGALWRMKNRWSKVGPAILPASPLSGGLVNLLIFGLLTTAWLAAQTLEVHSEFLRVNPQGEILPVDVDPKPREILSPAVIRNGFASFHIIVRSPRPTSFFLFVDTNPPNVFRTSIYKEQFVKRGGDWIPDALEL